MSPEQFRSDLLKSKVVIEDVINERVLSFRAPGFSVNSSNLWVFDILLSEGFEVDCSIFPAKRAHGGLLNSKLVEPFIYQSPFGSSLKCFPMSTFNFIGLRVAYSGGGYFRLLPAKILMSIFAKSKYNMTYFHPRDFDTAQPKLSGLSLFRSFKAYYGIPETEKKLSNVLKQHKFGPVSKYDGQFIKIQIENGKIK